MTAIKYIRIEKIEGNEKFKKLIEEKIIKRNGATQTGYRLNLEVQGITHILFTISGILKVCILACNYSEGLYSRIIPQPNINIQTALKHIYKLLPFEELDCLGEIIKNHPDCIINTAHYQKS
ncbi:MAG: hypothetical protein VYB38_04580 [Bacteroidota bacterium]|nr:hypothetical protein [Bacteroidota bacterium]